MRATLPSSSSKKLASSSSVVPTTTRKKRSAVRGGRTTIVKASSSSSAFSLFSFFKNREEEGEEERSSSSRSSVHRKRCTHENESTTLDRAIRASQSMVCQSIGGFNFGAFFCNDVTAAFDDAEQQQQRQQQQRRQKVEEKRGRGILNERLVWREEDGYERQMRLATASFLAATTVAVGQPALALDFVVVDPSVKEYMDRRDEAMSFKCKGGMMDCDGDRREFARNQAAGLKERLEKGEKRTECTVEEACTDNILGAALAGTSGFTTSEKFEKLGRPELADAPNASRPNLGF